MSAALRRDMNDAPGDAMPASSRRRTPFRVVATVMAVSAVAFGLFSAFGIIVESQRIHRFHNSVVASLLLVISAPPVIAAARSPERSLRPLVHLALVGMAGLITMVLSLKLDPFTLPFIVLVGVLWALRPAGGQLVAPGRRSPALLLLVLLSVVPLVTYALGQAELQRIDRSSEHAEFLHWMETSFYAAAVLLLGFLGALRPSVYRLSAWSAGLALAVLGGGSLAFSGYASALDTAWAWAALVGSLIFLSVAEWESRKETRGVRAHQL
jgi:hypothetical protein